MAGVKGKSGGDHKSQKFRGLDRPDLPSLPTNREEIGELIRTLEAPPKNNEENENPRAAGWRVLWDAPDLRIRLDTRKVLYQYQYGRPAQTVEVSGKNGTPIMHTIRFGDGKTDAKPAKS